MYTNLNEQLQPVDTERPYYLRCFALNGFNKILSFIRFLASSSFLNLYLLIRYWYDILVLQAHRQERK